MPLRADGAKRVPLKATRTSQQGKRFDGNFGRSRHTWPTSHGVPRVDSVSAVHAAACHMLLHRQRTVFPERAHCIASGEMLNESTVTLVRAEPNTGPARLEWIMWCSQRLPLELLGDLRQGEVDGEDCGEGGGRWRAGRLPGNSGGRTPEVHVGPRARL